METNRIVQTSGNRPSEHYTLLLIVMNNCHLYIILFIVCVCVCMCVCMCVCVYMRVRPGGSLFRLVRPRQHLAKSIVYCYVQCKRKIKYM